MRRKHFQIISLLLFGLIGLPSAIAQISLKQAQQYLQNKGLYYGKIDGLAGPKTRQAIVAFQKSEGLTVSGKLDQATAEKLATYVAGNTTDETIIVVQEIQNVDVVEEPAVEVVEQDVDIAVEEVVAQKVDDTAKDAEGTAKGAVQEADRAIGGELATAKSEVEATKSTVTDNGIKDAFHDAGSAVKNSCSGMGSAIGSAGASIKGAFSGKKK